MASRVVGSFFVASLVVGGLVFACGGTAGSDPGGDGGASSGTSGDPGPLDPTAKCGACTENACCNPPPVPDGFAEAYRCKAGKWSSDDTCLPPASCATPLAGTITGAGGATAQVSCLTGGLQNGVTSVALRISARDVIELHFDRAPVAGDVVTVLPWGFGPFPSDDAGADAGDGGASTQRYARFHIGQYGGFSGFSESATSKSGTITIASIEATGTKITSLHASMDVQTASASDAWGGGIKGSF